MATETKEKTDQAEPLSGELVTRGMDAVPRELLPSNVPGGLGVWCNFGRDKHERLKLGFVANGGNVMSRETLGSKPFPVKWWYVQAVQIAGPTPGELIDAYRVVLIAPDKTAVTFTSVGVLRSLAMIVGCYGDAVIDPPLMVKVTTKKARVGNVVFLELADNV